MLNNQQRLICHKIEPTKQTNLFLLFSLFLFFSYFFFTYSILSSQLFSNIILVFLYLFLLFFYPLISLGIFFILLITFSMFFFLSFFMFIWTIKSYSRILLFLQFLSSHLFSHPILTLVSFFLSFFLSLICLFLYDVFTQLDRIFFTVFLMQFL